MSGNPADVNGDRVPTGDKIWDFAVPFYVQNTSFVDTNGAYDRFAMMAVDMNDNDVYDIFEDEIIVGPMTSNNRWGATAFSIDFRLASSSTLPVADDVYRVAFDRPFFETDSVLFTVAATDSLDLDALANTMENIQVVPNPYVATNMMEPAVSNPFLNQRRRLLFTNIPSACTIKIFTISGILVDNIEVANDPGNGIVQWDMLTREGLEIAAGMYIYHVEADLTGDTKTGKFAVIK
jgi:hypothetical protein